jgi:hypothetical protein
MSPEAGKAALSIALFIVIASAALLLIQPPGTAEFVITVLSLAIGLVFTGVVMIMARRGTK